MRWRQASTCADDHILMEGNIWLGAGWMLWGKRKFQQGDDMKQGMAELRDLSYSSGNC